MRISVDPDSCVGAGQCVLSAPDVFDQDDDGLVTLVNPEPAPSEETDVREAARICPSRSITVHDG